MVLEDIIDSKFPDIKAKSLTIFNRFKQIRCGTNFTSGVWGKPGLPESFKLEKKGVEKHLVYQIIYLFYEEYGNDSNN